MTRNRYEGGDLVVEALKGLGVERIFSVSGGPLNSIYHAAHQHGLGLVHTRHEAPAVFMAEAASRLTGTPGVAAVTLGPGVTNAVTPALVAQMAGTPVLIIGAQAPTASFHRGAGMSADHVPIMAPVTKWSARVLQTGRIPEYIAAAWRTMWAGRPGPVFLEIPVDVLAAPAEPAAAVAFTRPEPGVTAQARESLRAALAGAERPLVILGDDVRWDAPDGLEAFLERNHLPFVTARLARGAVDEHHPLWAGVGYNPANATLRRALGEADLVLVLGHHLEFDLGFGGTVASDATIVQSNMAAALLGRNREAAIALHAAPSAVMAALDGATAQKVDRRWVDAVLAGWQAERTAQRGPDAADGALHPVAAVDAVTEAMPADTIYVSSHGNVDFWADARLRVRRPDGYLRAGQAGALGAEIPYGVGARFACPERPVVVFVGDGGAGYHVTELDTAARHGRPVIVVVLDDGKWGAIALPQKDDYGGEYAMDLPQRDWRLVAQGLGGVGFHARTPAEIANALKEAQDSGLPAIVQIPVASVLSPYMAFISQ